MAVVNFTGKQFSSVGHELMNSLHSSLVSNLKLDRSINLFYFQKEMNPHEIMHDYVSVDCKTGIVSYGTGAFTDSDKNKPADFMAAANHCELWVLSEFDCITNYFDNYIKPAKPGGQIKEVSPPKKKKKDSEIRKAEMDEAHRISDIYHTTSGLVLHNIDKDDMGSVKLAMSFLSAFRNQSLPSSPDSLGLATEIKNKIYMFMTRAKINNRVRDLIKIKIPDKIVEF
jgi:hypothetical protein